MNKEKKIKKLQKENDALVQNVLDKMEVIKELEADYDSLTRDYITLANRKAPAAPPVKKPKIKFLRSYILSFELNPARWLQKFSHYRFNWKKNNSDVREGQTDFGPFSFSWYRDRV